MSDVGATKTPLCPDHGHEMVEVATGRVRCPVITCQKWRYTTCHHVLRFAYPYRSPVYCGAAVAVETWAVGPDGQQVYHGGNCARHPDKSRYGGSHVWRIEYRKVVAA